MVVFSGGGTAGHFYPAVAIAGALAEELPGAEPFFVGTVGRIEAGELPKLGHPYRLLPLRGLRRPMREVRGANGVGAGAARFLGALAANAAAAWLLLAAVARLVPEFRRRRARAVVLTGGYVAAPAGVAGWLTGLPVVVQEQNMRPGVVARLASLWAREVHLAYPEAKAGLPRRARRRVRESGNPIRPLPPLAQRDKKAVRAAMELPANAVVVLVVGGSQGAHALNRATIEALCAELPNDREFVLWITGRTAYGEALSALTEPGKKRVRAVPYLQPQEMYRALAAADLAVSRGRRDGHVRVPGVGLAVGARPPADCRRRPSDPERRRARGRGRRGPPAGERSGTGSAHGRADVGPGAPAPRRLRDDGPHVGRRPATGPSRGCSGDRGCPWRAWRSRRKAARRHDGSPGAGRPWSRPLHGRGGRGDGAAGRAGPAERRLRVGLRLGGGSDRGRADGQGNDVQQGTRSRPCRRRSGPGGHVGGPCGPPGDGCGSDGGSGRPQACRSPGPVGEPRHGRGSRLALTERPPRPR